MVVASGPNPSAHPVSASHDRLTGTIVSDFGACFSGATVTVELAEGGKLQKILVGSDDRFEFAGLPPGTPCTVLVERGGFETSYSGVVRVGDHIRVDLHLRDFPIAGRLVDARGKPLRRTWLRFTPDARYGTCVQTMTEDDGSFRTIATMDVDYEVAVIVTRGASERDEAKYLRRVHGGRDEVELVVPR